MDGDTVGTQPTGIASLVQKAKAAGLDPGKLAALAAALPADVVASITAGKIDAEVMAKITATGLIDSAILAKLGFSTQGPAPGLSFIKPEVTPGEPLKLEIQSFIESVRTRREPRVTARQGRDALALALEIQASMEAHAERAGLKDFFRGGGAASSF
jgi:hypothetical protein